MYRSLALLWLLTGGFSGSFAQTPTFEDRLTAALFAAAIGDAMGAPIEGWHPEKIQERFPGWDFIQFLPPTREKDIKADKGKGNGRFTDDLLAIEAIINVYNIHQDHS